MIIKKNILFSLLYFVLTFCSIMMINSSIMAASNIAPNGNTYRHYYNFRRYKAGANSFYAEFYTDYKMGIWNSRVYYLNSANNLSSVQLYVPANYENHLGNDYIVTTYLSGMSGYSQDCIFLGWPDESSNMPVFDTQEDLIMFLQSPDEDDYEYNPNIGYLIGIKDKSKILSVNSNSQVNPRIPIRYFIFGWGSETSTGIDLEYGGDVIWFDDENQECYGSFSNIKCQAKLKLTGNVINVFTGNLIRPLPDEGSWYQFDDFDPYNPYQLSFDTLNLETWFSDYLSENSSSGVNGFLETFDFNCELYLRITGTFSDDDDPPNSKLVCGPWSKISFHAMNKSNPDKEDANFTVIGGSRLDENNNLVIDSGSPYGDGTSFAVASGSGSSYSAADNNVKIPDASNVSLSLNDLFSQIQQVPAIITSVFSFLPPWVLLFFTCCFSLVCVLIVIKTARG